MSLEPIITVDITIDSTGVPKQGFGIPIIASHTAAWAERTRDYGSTVEVGDDFATDSPEYLCAAAVFSQDNPPETVKIGRVASDVTQQYTLEAVVVSNSYGYSLGVSGEGFEEDDAEYTSDSAATKAEIHYGLLTALNAVVDKTYTAAFAALTFADAVFTADNATEIFTKAAHTLQTGDGPFQVSNAGGALPAGLVAATDYWAIRIDADTFYLATSLVNALAGTFLSITTNGTGVQTIADTVNTKSPILPFTATGDAANAWFSIDVPAADLAKINIRQTHAAGTLDEDLAAILVEDDEWYCLLTNFNSHDYAKEAAAWAESNGRIYVFDVNEYEAIGTAFDIDAPASTDTLGELCALEYRRTMYSYHPRPSAFFSAAWMGDWLPTVPGKATAAIKTLVGVETTKLTTTQLGRLEDRRASCYLRRGGRGITWESKVPSTEYEFLDVTRNVDYLKDGIATTYFGILAGAPIIPFTPAGTAQLAGGVLGFLTGEATENGVLDREQAPTVLPPKFSTIPTQDKKTRRYRQLKFTGRLSVAIHAGDVDGTLTF